jgi:hypothetical protein
MNKIEIQNKITAIEIIQELIVDILDEASIIQRKDFEILLTQRVNEHNKTKSKEETNYPFNLFGTPIGEA